MWLIAAVVTAMLSMGWLALSYQSHWQQVFPQTQAKPGHSRLKAFGWSFLLTSAACCLAADHPSMAVLVWVMLLALAAMTIGMILSRRPALLRLICPPFFAVNAPR
jgi:hypothetical protein